MKVDFVVFVSVFFVFVQFVTALQVFSEVNSTLDKRSFRQCIDTIVKLLTDEDAFDSLIDFLTKSVEVSRGVFYMRMFNTFSTSCHQYVLPFSIPHFSGLSKSASVVMLENVG